jgi:hypothetical protein
MAGFGIVFSLHCVRELYRAGDVLDRAQPLRAGEKS